MSNVIAKECCNMGLNPLRFDLGAYLFGVNEIKKMSKGEKSIDEIYNKLKYVLLDKDFT